MLRKYCFYGFLILIILFFTNCSSIRNTASHDIESEYSQLYSISDYDSVQTAKQNFNTIISLKQKLLNKEIEVLKTRRKLGWIIAIPSLSWTTLITIVGLSNPKNTEMDLEDCIYWGSGLTTAIFSYYGLSLIFDSNEKLTQLEKYDKPVSLGFIYKPKSKAYGLSFSLGL